jgi:predicted GNAT family acetyltransferase
LPRHGAARPGWPRVASPGGAFRSGRLAAVACSFFAGVRYEDIGVVTQPAERGQGLGMACAGALCAAIQGRGRQPSWSTSPDNTASLRVAEKLGFVLQRRDRLLVVGKSLPEPAQHR